MDFNQKIQFIEEIKVHPELYDKDNPHFHDYNKKEEIWNLIGDKFNIAEPKKKWATLRDKFVRLKRLRETAPSAINDHPYAEEKWNLYEPLLFLNNFCRHRKRSTFAFKDHSSLSNNSESFAETPAPKKTKSEKWKQNSSTIKNLKLTPADNFEFTAAGSSNDDDEHSTFDENPEIDNYCFADSNSVSNECSTTIKIKKEMLENERNGTDEFINSNINSKAKNDETENFLFIKMIGKKLELLPNKEKNKVQIQILQLVNKELDKCDC